MQKHRNINPLGLVISAVALARAVQIANGYYDPQGVAWLAVAIGGAAIAVFGTRRPAGPETVRRATTVAIAISLGLLVFSLPADGLKLGHASELAPYYAGLLVQIGLSFGVVAGKKRIAEISFVAMLAVQAILGLWIIGHTRTDFIDTWTFQRDSSRALLDGRNPYAITFPNLYPPGSPYYGPGNAADGHTLFGFPYPPLILIAAVPGYLMGDHRISLLLADLIAAGLIALTGRTRLSLISGVLFLTWPRALYTVGNSWTEPVVSVVLAAVVLASRRQSRSRDWLLGLWLTVKQYLLFAAPLAILLTPPGAGRQTGRMLVKAFLAGAVVTLPFVIWDLHAFLNSTVSTQLRQSFRTDALSFGAALYHMWKLRLPSAAGFFGLIGAMGFSLWRCPRTPAGFAAAVAFSYMVFFALSKFAFCNYYFFVMTAICCALATTDSEPTKTADHTESVTAVQA